MPNCEFCQDNDVTVGVVVSGGIVDEIIVSQDAEIVTERMRESLRLPEGISMDAWFSAQRLANGGADNADLLRLGIGLEEKEPVTPSWYDDWFADSTIETVNIIRKEE